MLAGLDPVTALYLAAVVFIGAFVRGYSGFGYPVVVVAAGAIVMNPLLLVPVAILGDLVLCIQHWPSARPHVRWGTSLRLVAGAALGLIPGIWLLAIIDENTARIVIGVMVLGACAVMLGGWTLPVRAGNAATLGMGVVSGLASPAGVAGPPAVMLVAALGLQPLVFRATLLAYFIVLDVLTFGQFTLAGRIDASVLIMTAASVPLVLLGGMLGARRVMRADPAQFRRMTILALMAMACVGLVRVLI